MSIQCAVLRDENGKHMYSLAGSEVDTFAWLAEQGEVDRLKIRRKGREMLVFKLKSRILPSILAGSPASACDLTVQDSKALAGLNGKPNSFQIERWMGYGLIPSF